MVSYCRENPQHLLNDHEKWCKAFQLFKQLIIHQEKFGRLEPQLPKKILRDLPANCCKTKDIYKKLNISKKAIKMIIKIFIKYFLFLSLFLSA